VIVSCPRPKPIAPMSSETRARVFGIGLMKTGTTSLGEALNMLGYRCLQGGRLETMFSVQQAIEEGKPMLTYVEEDFDAFTDIFGLTYYFFLADVQYPGSRFILTVRDLEVWLDSRRRHVEKNAQMKDAGQYHGELVKVDIDGWVAEHRRHEAVVRAFFADRPDDLLVFDLIEDGWEPLCEFLGKPTPDAPFPWENRYRPWVAPADRTPTQTP
jgi:Sulfotransferase domain